MAEVAVFGNDRLSSREKYPVHTYSAAHRINLKSAADTLFPGATERVSSECLVFHLSAQEKVFIFVFGTIVFFNIPINAHENYLTRLGIDVVKPGVTGSIAEDVAEDEVIVNVQPGVVEVGFNTATIPDLDLSYLLIVVNVLAQSSALELIEWEVEEFLAESERMTRFLQSDDHRRPRRRQLMKFIGSGLNAKHRILNQLALLSEPDKTWEKEELYKLYKDLFANLDIKERLDKIEKMLGLTAEVSELLLQLVESRRAEIMEIIIIVLIASELIRSFIFAH